MAKERVTYRISREARRRVEELRVAGGHRFASAAIEELLNPALDTRALYDLFQRHERGDVEFGEVVVASRLSPAACAAEFERWSVGFATRVGRRKKSTEELRTERAQIRSDDRAREREAKHDLAKMKEEAKTRRLEMQLDERAGRARAERVAAALQSRTPRERQ